MSKLFTSPSSSTRGIEPFDDKRSGWDDHVVACITAHSTRKVPPGIRLTVARKGQSNFRSVSGQPTLQPTTGWWTKNETNDWSTERIVSAGIRDVRGRDGKRRMKGGIRGIRMQLCVEGKHGCCTHIHGGFALIAFLAWKLFRPCYFSLICLT